MSLINDALKRASQAARNRPSQANLSTPMQPVPESELSIPRIILAGAAVILILALAGLFFLKWHRQRHAHPAGAVAATNAVQHPATAGVKKTPAGAPTTAAQQPATPAKALPPPAGAGSSAPPPAAVNPGPASSASSVKPAPGSAMPIPATSNLAGAAAPATGPVTVPSASPSSAAASSPQEGTAARGPIPMPSPMTPAVEPPPAALPAIPFPPMQVKGIFYNPRHSYVVINGEALAEGEHVHGVLIVKIQPNSVTVELNGRTKQMFLGE